MWAVLEICLLAAIVLISVTEFFIPVLFNKPLFGSFRKAKPVVEQITVTDDSLPEKLEKVKQQVDEVKVVVEDVQAEARKNYESAEELKDKSDNLL